MTGDKLSKLNNRKVTSTEQVMHRLLQGDVIKQFRVGWNMPREGFNNLDDFGMWFIKNKAGKVNQWDAGIELLVTKYRIPEKFKDYLEQCLVLKNPPHNVNIDSNYPFPELKYNKKTGRRELWVRIHADTRPNQFSLKSNMGAELWKKIKELQQELYDYNPKPQEIHEILFNAHYVLGMSQKKLRIYAKKKWGYSIKSDNDLSKYFLRIRKRLEPKKNMDKDKEKGSGAIISIIL